MKSIKYKKLVYRSNRGTDENPVYEDMLTGHEVICADEHLEAIYADVQTRAYGEIIVEEVEDEYAEPSTEDVINAMLGVKV